MYSYLFYRHVFVLLVLFTVLILYHDYLVSFTVVDIFSRVSVCAYFFHLKRPCCNNPLLGQTILDRSISSPSQPSSKPPSSLYRCVRVNYTHSIFPWYHGFLIMSPALASDRSAPLRLIFSSDGETVLVTDGLGPQQRYAEAITLSLSYHNMLPATNSNRFQVSPRGIKLKAQLVGRSHDLV